MAMKLDKDLEDELLGMLKSIQRLRIELGDKMYCFDYDCNIKDGAHELYIYYANEEQIVPEERSVPPSIQYLILTAVLNHIKSKTGVLKVESENNPARILHDVPQTKGGT